MTLLDKTLKKHAREISRALRNHKYEDSGNGILVAGSQLFVAGVWETTINHRDRQIDANTVPTEALNHLLESWLNGGTQIATWYMALFTGNVTPGLTLTAATFTSVCTEFTGYDETTRVEYAAAAAAAGVLDNDATRSEFTINATATLYGGALLSASAKSATTGTIGPATRFSASRGVVSGDTFQGRYAITAANA